MVCTSSSAARVAMRHWGQCPHTPRDGRTLLGHLGRAHTHHHNHIRRSRHRIRRFELRFGCHTVVCTSSSASRVTMGHWGQCPHTPPRDGRTLLGYLGGAHTHTTTTILYGSNCGSGRRTMMCTSTTARDVVIQGERWSSLSSLRCGGSACDISGWPLGALDDVRPTKGHP